jgi:hypothetical protein
MAKKMRSMEKETFWRDAIGRQVASGLSVRAFCRSQSLREASFYSWRRTLEGRRREKTPRRANHDLTTRKVGLRRQAAPSFVPALVNSLPSDLSIVLELASGCRLKLSPSISMSQVAELVLALESRGKQ